MHQKQPEARVRKWCRFLAHASGYYVVFESRISNGRTLVANWACRLESQIRSVEGHTVFHEIETLPDRELFFARYAVPLSAGLNKIADPVYARVAEGNMPPLPRSDGCGA